MFCQHTNNKELNWIIIIIIIIIIITIKQRISAKFLKNFL